MTETRDPTALRSHRWLGPDDLRAFGHRSRLSQMGFAREDYVGKPVIAILSTWSDLNPCHAHFPQRVDEIKRGVWQQGGFPVELPTLSLPEIFMKPTTMLYRNLLAMEAEELLRSHPVDGAVLMAGCDKTTPALVMAATSVDLPAVVVPAGPMLPGRWRGGQLASGTDTWRHWAERRAGNLPEDAWREIEDGIARSPGTCMTMGTASTMTSAVEVLGLTLPGAASIPAVDAQHARLATAAGRVAVDMVWEDRRPSTLLTSEAFHDAATVVLALGGSTNALIHLIAMSRRAGADLDLDRFDELSRTIPVLVDLQPTGRFLMDDFHRAGGVPALLTRLRDRLHLDRPTIDGRTLGAALDGAEVTDHEVIRPVDEPVAHDGGIAVLRGNLAPDGAVIKHAAATPDLLVHTGPAAVFDSYDELTTRLAQDETITADTVLVLRNAGPVGGPGMPEWGMLPLPDRLLRDGVRDMVRVSDARMSGTSYGTCVLHVAPEAWVGGPLAFVEDGDPIELDVPARRITLAVDDEVLTARRAAWTAPAPRFTRGYGALASRHIEQADVGCDFDFLAAGPPTPEPEIH